MFVVRRNAQLGHNGATTVTALLHVLEVNKRDQDLASTEMSEKLDVKAPQRIIEFAIPRYKILYTKQKRYTVESKT